MTKLSDNFVEYFMPDGSSNLDLEIAIYKGIKALEASIKEKDEQIEAMKCCTNCINYPTIKCMSTCMDYSNWQMKTKG